MAAFRSDVEIHGSDRLGGTGKTSLVGGPAAPLEDAERALGVAVETLRALLAMPEVRAEP